MEVEIRINEQCREPRIIIETPEVTAEIQTLLARLGSCGSDFLVGFRDGIAQILDPSQIIRIYTSGRHIEAETSFGVFRLKIRLYEAEEHLATEQFVRISNAEIVNLQKVKGFDLSRTGVVRVIFQNGNSTFVSRRFIPRIRKLLGI